MLELIPVIVIIAWMLWLFTQRRARSRPARAVDGQSVQKVLATYDRQLKINPRNANAFFQRARLHRENGDLSTALRDYSSAIQLNARFTWAYIGRAIVHTLQNRYAEALNDYQMAERLEPELTEIYNSRAWTHTQCGDYAAAAADYTTLIRLDSETLEKTIKFGAYMGGRDMDQVLRRRLADWHNQRGITHQQRQAWDEAALDHTIALEFNTELEDARLQRAWVYYRQGDIKGAVAEYTDLITRKASPQHYLNRAAVYLKTRNLPLALADFTSAITLLMEILKAPEIASAVKATLEEQLRFAHSLRGAAYAYSGDRDRALADHDTAIRLKPEEAGSYSDRGETHFVLGDYIMALNDFEQALRLAPDLQTAKAGKAVTHFRMGETEEAVRLWRELVAQDARYRDPTWFTEQLNWPDAMVSTMQTMLPLLDSA